MKRIFKREQAASPEAPTMMKVYRAPRALTADAIEMQGRASLLRSMLASNREAQPSTVNELKHLESVLASLSRHTLMVSPGVDHPEIDEFFYMIPQSRMISGQPGSPVRMMKTLAVQFVDGEAEVDVKVGRYLISKGIASKRPPATVQP